MPEFKQIESEHVDYLCRYLARKVADKTLVDLLEDPDTQGAALKALEKVLRTHEVEPLQQWFDRYLSRKGRAKTWTACRNAPHRKQNPRSKQELRKPVVQEVMAWAKKRGIKDLNEAVLALLEQSKK